MNTSEKGCLTLLRHLRYLTASKLHALSLEQKACIGVERAHTG